MPGMATSVFSDIISTRAGWRLCDRDRKTTKEGDPRCVET